ncbi:MAG: leucyl/phenylalanyl-tRNA--protein transferase [Bacteroidetes bacterium]|nr:leucyl/phenylalanyl-tRNA--protein transferase [Bacteroidota bacterium]
MAIFRLNKELAFPDPSYAEEEGILALGGDLSVDRLVLAYANGIFPWYTEDSPILWWSPDPRMVLFPDRFKVSKSLKQLVRSDKYTFTYDKDFDRVIRKCAEISRKGQNTTWITREMLKAYANLHEAGFAHSVETWFGNELVGGLYGISLGKAFFGESMFYDMRDASKFALYHLIDLLKKWDFELIDAQQDTEHLRSLGAISIPRNEFLDKLEMAVTKPTKKGNWNNYL